MYGVGDPLRGLDSDRSPTSFRSDARKLVGDFDITLLHF